MNDIRNLYGGPHVGTLDQSYHYVYIVLFVEGFSPYDSIIKIGYSRWPVSRYESIGEQYLLNFVQELVTIQCTCAPTHYVVYRGETLTIDQALSQEVNIIDCRHFSVCRREKRVLQRFKPFRRFGEFFDPHPTILSFAKGMRVAFAIETGLNSFLWADQKRAWQKWREKRDRANSKRRERKAKKIEEWQKSRIASVGCPNWGCRKGCLCSQDEKDRIP